MTETTEDLSLGYLQIGDLRIEAEGPVISWAKLRVATKAEAELAAEHPVFWYDPEPEEIYHRHYPKHADSLLARVVPAAQVLGEGQLRVMTFPPERRAAVVIVDEKLHVLVPGRQFELTERAQLAYLTEEMRNQAVAFATEHGYFLSGVWQHGADGSHRTSARPCALAS